MRQALALTLLLRIGIICAQPGANPTFEVASVKPSGEKDYVIGLFTYPGGRITATNYTLRTLIHEAYDIEDYRILGGPNWTQTERYNVEAKPPASSLSSKWVPANFKTPPTPELRQMLQNLLAERFQLKVHREQRKESVYALVVAKSGPKLSSPKDSAHQPFVSFMPDGLRGDNATIDLLVERLASLLRRPVLNQTGIKSNFDFYLKYEAQAIDAEGRLLTPLQEQLGLKLESRPGSLEVIVIDGAEKPSTN